MNTENANLQSLDAMQGTLPPPRRGWWSRNWLWFVPTFLLGSMIICCGCITGIFYVAVHFAYEHEVFKTAMTKIQADDNVRRELGEPITIPRWPPPTCQIESINGAGEAKFYWDIEGPKGRARAHVQARQTDNRWEIILLDVTPANGKKLLLSSGGADAAPLFKDTPSDSTAKPAENGPPPEITLPTFDDPTGGK